MQQRGFVGPVALVLVLLPALLAGCSPTAVPHPDEPRHREGTQALSGSEPYLVRDLNPNGVGAKPIRVAVARGTLFFSRIDLRGDSELWKSDGTQAGTVMVKRFTSNPFGHQPLAAVGGTMFLYDRGYSALWKSDGTEAGTVRVLPESSDSNASGNLPEVTAAKELNGRLYMLTRYSLWVSDGTAAGTVPLKSFPSDGPFQLAGKLLSANGQLFFTGSSPSGGTELWKSDGTAAGTALLGSVSSSQTHELVAVNGTVFLSAPASTNDWALWKSDGTPEGTVIIQEGFPLILNLKAAHGRVFFSSHGVSPQSELWTSDGTKDGTLRLASFAHFLGALMETDGGIVFAVEQDGLGLTLWRSDGTEAGTQFLQDPCPGITPRYPYTVASVNGEAFYTLYCEASDPALWKSDGTVAGTGRVTDTSLRTDTEVALYGPPVAVELNGTLLFWADDGVHGFEPWKSDGTAAGTVLVRDLMPARAGSEPRDFVALGETAFFIADDGRKHKGLWKSDGTAAGTVFVKDVALYGSGGLARVKETLFFFHQGIDLWKSDGTTDGTVRVKNLSPSHDPGQGVSEAVDFGGTLFFVVWDQGRTGLWKSDGTEAGTVQVKALPPLSYPLGRVSSLVVVNGSLFFVVGDGSTRLELWKSDGTEAGTVFVKTLFQGSASTQVRSAVAAGGKLFLLIDSQVPAVWTSDGTEAGTLQPPALRTIPNPGALVQADGMLLLLSHASGGRLGLWKSDGTVAGTTRLLELASTLSDPRIGYAANVRGRLHFTLYSPLSGAWELWRSDGTAQGTGMVHRMEQGHSYELLANHRRSSFAEAGKRLFFLHDGGQGREPWVLPLAPVECPFPRVTAEATGPDGARVDFPPVRRAGDVDPSLPISYSQAPGSLFPLGDTRVTLTASDPAYPASTCTFSVSVQDTTAPTLQCPKEVTAESPNGNSLAVQYPPATATDAVSTPALEYTSPAGSTFSVGSNSVTVKATDAAGNSQTCSFRVFVQTAPQGCGCGSTSPAAALGWLLLLAPWVLRRRAHATRMDREPQ